MTDPIVLVLPYPVSANAYWGTRTVVVRGRAIASTYVTDEARAYREAIGWIAKGAGVRTLMRGRLTLHLQLFPSRPVDWQSRMRKLGDEWDTDVRCIDLGNCEKVLSDALQGTVIENDKRFWKISLERMEPDALGARIVATIAPLQRGFQQQPALEMDLPVPALPAAEPVGGAWLCLLCKSSVPGYHNTVGDRSTCPNDRKATRRRKASAALPPAAKADDYTDGMPF